MPGAESSCAKINSSNSCRDSPAHNSGLSMTPTLRALLWLALLVIWPGVVPTATFGLVATAEAQGVTKVWVNTKSGVYHCPGSRYYGTTKPGQFVTEGEARAAGNRPAYGQPCGPSREVSTPVDSQPFRLATPAEPVASGVKVWVNTSSGLYHCPGSHYYGNTKSGRFMSEGDARAAGNRSAYGKVCS